MQVHSVLGHNLFSPLGKLMVSSVFFRLFREWFWVAVCNVGMSLLLVQFACVKRFSVRLAVCRCVLPVKRKY